MNDHEKIAAEQSDKIVELHKLLHQCLRRFRKYEMDVDDSPPEHHKRFIAKLKEALDE